MTRLIIAEKHSVAQAIAQALDTSAIRKDGPVPGPRLGALADGYAAP